MIDCIGWRACTTFALLAAVIPGVAVAQSQDAATADTAPTGDPTDIIVTALKRDTRLESTPIAITVLNGDALVAQGVTQIGDLRSSVPSVTLSESPGGLTGISVRGVGTSASSQAFEQSVGLFLDGIYHPRARQYRDALFDLEQVEVIKGSQGVLFGKNTSVGAISIRTRNPGFSFGGDLTATYETEFDSKLVQGGINVPLGDHAAIRVAGLYEDEGGYVYNVVKDRDEPNSKRVTGRVTFLAEPTENLTVTIKAQGGHLRTRGDAFDFVVPTNPTVAIAVGVADGGQTLFRKYDSSGALGDSFDRQNSFDSSITLAWDVGGVTLTSLTGYSAYSFENGFDSDNSPLPLVYQLFNERFDQFTQEVRASTNGTGPVQATAGLFYLDQNDRFDSAVSFLNLVRSGLNITGLRRQVFSQQEQTYSAFGQVIWSLGAGIKATGGVRFSHDRKDGDYLHINESVAGTPPSAFFALYSPPGTIAATIKDDSFDFSGTLSYDLTERAVAYVSVGRGTKSGGFNNNALSFAATPAPLSVAPEEATTYEAGIKGRFIDGRAYVALAGFMVDISNFQDSYFDATRNGYIIRSLGAKTRGVEGEFRLTPVRWFTLFGNASYLPTAELATRGRMQRAPKFTSVAGAKIDTPVTDDWSLGLSGQWSHASNSLNQAPSAPGVNGTGTYDLYDARVSATSTGAGLEIYVAGANLSNERYREFSYGGILGAGTVGVINRPRTITIGARKTF